MNELELNWGLKNQARSTSSKNHQAATICGFKFSKTGVMPELTLRSKQLAN